MNRVTLLAASLPLIVSLNAFAVNVNLGEEYGPGTIRASAQVNKICGFTIEHGTSDIAYGSDGLAKLPGKIKATANFDAFFGLKLKFDNNDTVGLQWIAKSDKGKTHAFTNGDDYQFVQLNNDATALKDLEIDLFPRLTAIKSDLEMEEGEFITEAVITMKCNAVQIT